MSKIGFNLAQLGIVGDSDKAAPGQVALANESSFNNSFLSSPLTAYAVGWQSDRRALETLLDFLAPPVQTARRFEYKVANNTQAFAAEEKERDVRALYGEFAQIKPAGENISSKTLSKGLSILLELDEISENPGLEEVATASLLRMLYRAEILRAVALLSSVAINVSKTWGTGTTVDPDMDLLGVLTAMGDDGGLNPNRICFGQTAWQNRVRALRANNTPGGFANASMTPQNLADFLAVDDVAVCRERYATGSGKSGLVTNNLVFLFNAQNGASKDDPSNIKRFWSPEDGGGGMFKVFAQDTSSHLRRITVSHRSNIVITSNLGIGKITVA